MAHDIEIAGATYSAVPGIAVPMAAGGTALYLDAEGYVTLATSQTVTGSKTFAGGLAVSGGAAVDGGIVVGSGAVETNAGNLFANRTDGQAAMCNVKTSGGANSRYIRVLAQPNGNAGLFDVDNSKWIVSVDSAGAATFSGYAASAGSAGSAGNAGTASDASSLGGVAAANFVQKTSHVRCGSVEVYGAGTSVTSGQTRSVNITFSPAFDSVPMAVVVTTRGGSGSLAAQHSSYVYTKTASSCALRLKNTGGAGSATAACYIDWIAVNI